MRVCAHIVTAQRMLNSTAVWFSNNLACSREIHLQSYAMLPVQMDKVVSLQQLVGEPAPAVIPLAAAR